MDYIKFFANWIIYALLMSTLFGIATQSPKSFISFLLYLLLLCLVVFFLFARKKINHSKIEKAKAEAYMNEAIERIEMIWQAEEEALDKEIDKLALKLVSTEECTAIQQRTKIELSKHGIADLWREEIEKLRDVKLLEEELFSEYRKIVLRLYDNVNMYYSEELDFCGASQLIWQMEASPYSFRKFCEALGK